MNIILPPGPGSGQYGPFDAGRPAVLRSSTLFYYRKVGHPFHVSMLADRRQLMDQEILSFSYELPDSVFVHPSIEALRVAELNNDGRIGWAVTGSEIGASRKIRVGCGPYSATRGVVIAENVSGKGYGNPFHPSGK